MKSSLETLCQGTRINKLVLVSPGPYTWRGKSKWVCDCGRVTEKFTGNMTRGEIKSCGKCNGVSSGEMRVRKFGKLRMKSPEFVTSGSAKSVSWVCDCGKEVKKRICDVFAGVSSCGHCTDVPISEVSGKKFKKLCLIDAKGLSYITPQSHRKLTWLCDCGKKTEVKARSVLSGMVGSCGRCNEVSSEDMASRKFNKLRLKDPMTLKSGSNKKTWWICDCGRESYAQIVAVMSGRTKSCGRCSSFFKEKYEENKDEIRKLRTPISPDKLPDWCPIALQTITSGKKPFRAKCRLCGNEYAPRWGGIRRGISLTCGCSTYRVSHGQNSLFKFISGHVEARLEHKVGDLTYDIWVPSKNLVIEYNGLRWHSVVKSKRRDIAKYENAKKNGFDFVMFFEDEWTSHPESVKNFLMNKLGCFHPKSVRPNLCEVKLIEKRQADNFFKKYHYIGAARALVNYGVFFESKLVACCSFSRPTRQSKHDWELVRMSSHPNFRVHGIWSKVFKKFVREYGPNSVVSFSDNRLFDGRVYEKIGFELDGHVRSDYYWVKGNKRHHKSKLRKTREEKLTGKTESQLRTAQGYRQIWDLGKKRWIFKTNRNPDASSSITKRANI